MKLFDKKNTFSKKEEKLIFVNVRYISLSKEDVIKQVEQNKKVYWYKTYSKNIFADDVHFCDSGGYEGNYSSIKEPRIHFNFEKFNEYTNEGRVIEEYDFDYFVKTDQLFIHNQGGYGGLVVGSGKKEILKRLYQLIQTKRNDLLNENKSKFSMWNVDTKTAKAKIIDDSLYAIFKKVVKTKPKEIIR